MLNRAQGVAATPYQGYTGELTAPINAQQNLGISGINAASGEAQPAINQALGLASGAANPLTAAQIQQYQNPYTQNVVDATQAQFNNQNQQQQQQLTGNAISQGALGGNRVGVAQANLAGQQALAQAPTIANLYSQSYQQGLGAAERQFQQNPLAAAGSIANFGISGQNAALTGAGAQLGAGTVQQQNEQQRLQSLYQQYQQQQAYPYQQTQWLAGLASGVGPGLGSSSTGQSTGPAPNQTSQYIGAGLAAASFLARGGRVQHFDGGGVAKTPWGDAPTWIPQISLGNVAPHAGSAPGVANTATPAFDYSKIIAGNNKDSNGLISGPSYGGGNIFTDSYGGSSSSPLEGLSAADYGPGFARGGVAGYADGGAPDDPFGDDNRSIAYDLLRKGQGIQAPPSIEGGEPAPGVSGAVVNPDEPYRLTDPIAMDDWRAGHPLPGSGVAPAAPSDDAEELPPEITGRPKGAPAGAEDGQAMGYAPAGLSAATPGAASPTATEPSGGGLGIFNMSPNVRSGLLAAGLGMLASRSPNLGNAIGEGGLAGMSAYGAGQERDRKVADEAAKLSREAAQHAEEMKFKTAGQAETARHNKATEANAADKLPAGYQRTKDGEVEAIPGGPADPEQVAKLAKAKQSAGGLSDTAKDIKARQMINGDMSWATNLGRGAQAGKTLEDVSNHAAEILTQEGGMSSKEAAAHLSQKLQEFKASGIYKNAEARTAATREANLNLILNATEAAIPAALEASKAVSRTGWVPINKIIQHGQVIASSPELKRFGMANLQLAEHWARAMNPLGVMRESDRDKALEYLNTADSDPTYAAAVDQLHTQILRERDAVRKGSSMPSPNAPAGGSTEPAAIPPADKRVDGQVYTGPNGKKGQWNAKDQNWTAVP